MRAALSVLTLALTPALSPAADWPRFRGPNGTGVADGVLPPIDPAKPLWKAAIPGRGVSSPVVAGGKLFVQSAEKTSRLVLCLDAATGKTLWTRELPGKVAHTHDRNTLASGTPAVADGRVFVVAWDGEAVALHAFTADGKDLWSQGLGTFTSQHGPGHSPAVYNGTVFVNVDQDGSAVLKAFDAKTGEPRWAVPRPANRASYSTPSLLERPGKPAELLVGTTTAITAYDPATGKVVWEYLPAWASGEMPLRVVGGPVYAGGRVVCAFGDGGGARYLMAVDPDGPKPAKAWELRNKPTPYVPCLLAKDGRVYWITDKGRRSCVDARTGAEVWEAAVAQQEVTASPILVGGEVFAVTETGRWFVWEAGPELGTVRRGEIGEPVSASPAVADGRLYVRGDRHLFCFGPK
ncbi:MAG: PQQ-binding-like beta-propeller repeat protein [Gemmataceae bacterium]|nr:PQQ-binding-like beta-propeller repeat protein [Gemmataceae bacterium]